MAEAGMSRATAALICCVLLLAGLVAFLPYLDRYPEPYFDDCVYNQPAIRAYDGLGLTFSMAPTAPHGEAVWAYHGPFFPRMQTVTFRLFGVSRFTTRAPQYIAVFLAVGLVCGVAIRFGYVWSAVGLAVLWLGDRSLVESLYGRMDGIALLFLAIGFAAFAEAVRRGSLKLLPMAGFGTGMAVGFHPVAAVFAVGVGAGCCLAFPRARMKALLAYASGGLVPALLILLHVAPYFRESWEQFRWHRSAASGKGFLENAANVIRVLQWSRYWMIALFAATAMISAPVVARRMRKDPDAGEKLVFSSALFAVCGALAVLSVSQLPYYLIYFSIWAVISVLTALESGRAHRVAWLALAVLLLAWLPSAAWNVMRWREARLFYVRAAPDAFIEKVRAAIPPGAPVQVSPELFLLARPMGAYSVRAPLGKASDMPRDAWLVMYDFDLNLLGGLQAEGFIGRRVVLQSPIYPQAPEYAGSFTVLSPAAALP